jgi:hypothetical protein
MCFDLADLAGGVVEQRLLLCRIHLPEQVARLLPVIVIHAVIPVRGGAGDLEAVSIGMPRTATSAPSSLSQSVQAGWPAKVAMPTKGRSIRSGMFRLIGCVFISISSLGKSETPFDRSSSFRAIATASPEVRVGPVRAQGVRSFISPRGVYSRALEAERRSRLLACRR